MEFLALLIGGSLTLFIQVLKSFGIWVKPKTVVVFLAVIGGIISVFLTPEESTKILAVFTTGIASASGIYEYLKPYLKN